MLFGVSAGFMFLLFLFFLKSVFFFLCLLLGVGFYTLLERKVLGYIQLRKGPNKVGYIGVPQPLADALKLFVKEFSRVSLSNKFVFLVGPVFALFVVLVLWSLYFSVFGFGSFKLGVLFFLCVSSLNVYAVLGSGWSSNSKYALLGAVRSVAQTISYEVSMALVIFCVLLFSFSFDLSFISFSQFCIFFSFLIPPIFFM